MSATEKKIERTDDPRLTDLMHRHVRQAVSDLSSLSETDPEVDGIQQRLQASLSLTAQELDLETDQTVQEILVSLHRSTPLQREFYNHFFGARRAVDGARKTASEKVTELVQHLHRMSKVDVGQGPTIDWPRPDGDGRSEENAAGINRRLVFEYDSSPDRESIIKRYLSGYSGATEAARALTYGKAHDRPCIYLWINLVTLEAYVGKATNFYRRTVQHCQEIYGARRSGSPLLNAAIHRYGASNFLVMSVRTDFYWPTQSSEAESFYIRYLRSQFPSGYNSRP